MRTGDISTRNQKYILPNKIIVKNTRVFVTGVKAISMFNVNILINNCFNDNERYSENSKSCLSWQGESIGKVIGRINSCLIKI